MRARLRGAQNLVIMRSRGNEDPWLAICTHLQRLRQEFTFTSEDQAFFRSAGTPHPTLQELSSGEEEQMGGGGGGGGYQRAEPRGTAVVCSGCGQQTTVPFERVAIGRCTAGIAIRRKRRRRRREQQPRPRAQLGKNRIVSDDARRGQRGVRACALPRAVIFRPRLSFLRGGGSRWTRVGGRLRRLAASSRPVSS